MHCDTRDFIQRFLYFFGTWEPNLTAWLPRRLRAGDTFVDVGANIGYYSLLASRTVGPQGRVVAIEAAPWIHSALVRNLELNADEYGARNVRAVCAAASDAERTLTLVSGGEHNIGGTMTVDGPAAPDAARVQARPLYELLAPDERARARVIKIDVEGAEWEVLAGLRLDAPDWRTDLELVVEVAPERLAERGQSAAALLARMRALGFHTYALDNDYRSRTYLYPQPIEPPVRFDGDIDRQGDVVFSRVDARTL